MPRLETAVAAKRSSPKEKLKIAATTLMTVGFGVAVSSVLFSHCIGDVRERRERDHAVRDAQDLYRITSNDRVRHHVYNTRDCIVLSTPRSSEHPDTLIVGCYSEPDNFESFSKGLSLDRYRKHQVVIDEAPFGSFDYLGFYLEDTLNNTFDEVERTSMGSISDATRDAVQRNYHDLLASVAAQVSAPKK